MNWFSRLRRRSIPSGAAPQLPARRETNEQARVDFSEFTPDILPFLGQAAYIQLENFENLARAVSAAPTLTAKEGLTRSAAGALSKHHELIELIRRQKAEPDETMAPFAPAIDAFRESTLGSDWWELLVTSYVTAGILDDFFTLLAAGLPERLAAEVSEILRRPGATEVIADLVRTEIAADPMLGHRLALWARRLVGDTLLVTRSALRGAQGFDDVEPVFTELIAEHTRRMDVLGLTA